MVRCLLEALEALQTFALDHLLRELPEGLSTQIFQALDAVWANGLLCPRTRKAKDLEFIYNRMVPVPFAPTNSEFLSIKPGSRIAQLLMFNSANGREEFARQLTVQLSERFMLVDPEDAIKYWHTNNDSEVGTVLQGIIEFERALCSWVTSTVLEQNSPEERRAVLEFWLDISAVGPFLSLNPAKEFNNHYSSNTFGAASIYETSALLTVYLVVCPTVQLRG